MRRWSEAWWSATTRSATTSVAWPPSTSAWLASWPRRRRTPPWPRGERGTHRVPGPISSARAWWRWPPPASARSGRSSRFAGEAGVDSLTLVTWRAALGATVVGLFIGLRFAVAGIRPRALASLPVRDRWFMLAAAVANTILNLAAFIAFGRITIALTLLVFYLYPAGVAVASMLWFGERLDRTRWIALAVSLGGMVLVVAGAGSLGERRPHRRRPRVRGRPGAGLLRPRRPPRLRPRAGDHRRRR